MFGKSKNASYASSTGLGQPAAIQAAIAQFVDFG
jgi:hypothetical protein